LKFVDIHTHIKQDGDLLQLLDLSGMQGAGVYSDTNFSLGIHPWYIKENLLNKELERIEKHIHAKSFLAIGECGLDKVCDTDWDLQNLVFQKQVFLSEKYKKPVLLHVVKAFNELVLLRKTLELKQVWIIHGFNGSPQLAEQLMGLGMYISFGAQLESSTSKASRSIGSVPIHRLFLETDTSALTIEAIYNLAARRLNMDVDKLKKQLWRNFKAVFQKDF
jgi:TatD DNase family protein